MGAGVGQPEGAARHASSPAAGPGPGLRAILTLQRLDQPALRHVEHQQHAGDHEEHAELEQEVVQVAARQRIVERLVPAVEPDLAVGGHDHHDGHAGDQSQQPLARPRSRRARAASCAARVAGLHRNTRPQPTPRRVRYPRRISAGLPSDSASASRSRRPRGAPNAGDEGGVAPGQLPRRGLRAGALIELLRHVPAGGV